MTHTITPVYQTRDGDRHILVADLAVSSLETASGETITPNINIADGGLGMTTVLLLTNAPLTTNGRFAPVYDHSAGKMRFFLPGQSGGLDTESWGDVYGGIFANVTADAASAALNDALVMALTDATVTTSGGLAHANGKTTGLTNPNSLDAEVYGRNVVVAQNQNGAGGTWTAGWVRITGTAPDGSAQVEDIALQTTAIADTKFRLTVGTKAFGTVTSVKLLNTGKTAAQAGPASSRLSVGVGTIFGLRGGITAESDIKSVRKDAATIAAATYVGTASPPQIDMGANVADDVDIIVEYQASVTEVAAGTDCGTVRIMATGL